MSFFMHIYNTEQIKYNKKYTKKVVLYCEM